MFTFKKRFISIARKQPNSILVTGLLLYPFLFHKHPKQPPQIFTPPNHKSQPTILFNIVPKHFIYFLSKLPQHKKHLKNVHQLLT
ncbi:phage terminase family protein, partial [Staphylococcus epidermidis]|uniref:phage terminase family protein n=1 Tax=Staphylococcus epidermidis TaxID=1282 RepID=UPI001C936DA3